MSKESKIDLAQALEAIYEEVDYMAFYRDLFPIDSFEKKGVYEDGKYNGIAISISIGANKTRRFVITDDLEVVEDMVATNDFCLMSPISYAGKNRSARNARFMYALAIDLDGIETIKQWNFFICQVEKGHEMLRFVWGIPKPTYLISSGTGIHIYYVFERPIPMFKNIVKQLEILKRRITWQAWTQGASSLHDNVQYESLFQGFRVVGTATKTGGRCRAFKVGEKVSIEYLNKFVPEEYQMKNFTYQSNLTLSEAEKKYPEWYEKRIVQKQPKGTWTCKKDLYDWWIRTLSEGAEQGHRYWCIMTLATYAKKCGVPLEMLEEDAYGLIPLMNERGNEPFTEDDVMAALEAYNDNYITYPIHAISARTGIPIEKNKRNGRKRKVHIDYMNNQRAFKVKIGECTNGGRPKGSGEKHDIVYQWRQEHPDGRKSECKADTGLTYPTIRKWWDYVPPHKPITVDIPRILYMDNDELQVQEWVHGEFVKEMKKQDKAKSAEQGGQK